MRIRKTISLLLLVVYAFVFASTHFFYHSHQLADGTIVHSHILFGHVAHTHNAVQLQVIDQMNTAPYECEEPVQIELIHLEYIGQLEVARDVTALPLRPAFSFSLRAPPAA